jgi:hypothetical protein
VDGLHDSPALRGARLFLYFADTYLEGRIASTLASSRLFALASGASLQFLFVCEQCLGAFVLLGEPLAVFHQIG